MAACRLVAVTWDPCVNNAVIRSAVAAESTLQCETSKRRAPAWRVDPGEYTLHVGRSSADIAHRIAVQVERPPTG